MACQVLTTEGYSNSNLFSGEAYTKAYETKKEDKASSRGSNRDRDRDRDGDRNSRDSRNGRDR